MRTTLQQNRKYVERYFKAGIKYRKSQAESAIAWDDPDLAIDWKVRPEDVILSDKDRKHPRLTDCRDLFDWSDDLYK